LERAQVTIRAGGASASGRGVQPCALDHPQRSRRAGRGPGSGAARLPVLRWAARRAQALAARHRAQFLLVLAAGEPSRRPRRLRRPRRRARGARRGGARGAGDARCGQAHAQRRDRRAARAVPRGAGASRARGPFVPGDRARRGHPDRHGDVAARARAAAARRGRPRRPPGRGAEGGAVTRGEASKLLPADADGELDPAAALAPDAHLPATAQAPAAHEALRGMSAAIRAKADYHVAPAGFAQRLGEAVPPSPGETPLRFRLPRWLPSAAAFAGAVALAWVIALAAMRPGEDERLA